MPDRILTGEAEERHVEKLEHLVPQFGELLGAASGQGEGGSGWSYLQVLGPRERPPDLDLPVIVEGLGLGGQVVDPEAAPPNPSPRWPPRSEPPQVRGGGLQPGGPGACGLASVARL